MGIEGDSEEADGVWGAGPQRGLSAGEVWEGPQEAPAGRWVRGSGKLDKSGAK